MSSLWISSLALACIFAAALVGMVLGRVLPGHHLGEDTKDVVKMGTGVIATLSALILGLLVASAKGTFDSVSEELARSAGNVILLDRLLLQYGTETGDAREALRRAVGAAVEQLHSIQRIGVRDPNAPTFIAGIESVGATLRRLSPVDEGQRWIQGRALDLTGELTRARWLIVGQAGDSLPVPFLVVLVCWLSIIFASFGLFAPRNPTVVTVLFLCALSVAGSIFLIAELGHPIGGTIQVSSAPLRTVLEALAP